MTDDGRISGLSPREFAIEVGAAAAVAFTLAENKMWSAASASVETIYDDYGGPGVYGAIITWIDHALETMRIPRDPETDLSVHTINEETLELDGPLPANLEWATRLIRARATDSQGAFDHTLMELRGQDPAETGSYVMAVLNFAVDVCATPREDD